MALLPATATAASRVRFELARQLAAACPLELGTEIALTGSASRGVADDLSDIELNLWTEQLPRQEQCVDWLRRAGASDITPQSSEPAADDLWVTCRLNGIWAEVGWSETTRFDALLHRLLSAEVIAHNRLLLASMVLQAILLRTGGVLPRWQQELAQYPTAVQAAVIKDNTAVWSDPHVPGVRWALAQRGERFALALRLSWDIQNVLRVLFAINNRWDQDWKWTDPPCAGLPHQARAAIGAHRRGVHPDPSRAQHPHRLSPHRGHA